ncbi:MAG: copper resistance protein CopC [Chloroflexi bacterium]|nr:copper resistance protein CopC [Chloroflexota bacterium]
MHLRIALPSVLLFVLAVASAEVASAHAQYSSSNPPSNGTVQTLPSILQVTFTEELAAMQFNVRGPDGTEVTTGPAQIDLQHRTNASVPLRGAGPGTYTVVWHNVSGDDGDPNDGSFVFTVAGPPAAAMPTPMASNASAPTTVAAAPAANVPASGDDAITKGINDVRVNTYRKRQAIRDQYRGKIDELTFNLAIASGEGLENALKDAMAALTANGAH